MRIHFYVAPSYAFVKLPGSRADRLFPRRKVIDPSYGDLELLKSAREEESRKNPEILDQKRGVRYPSTVENVACTSDKVIVIRLSLLLDRIQLSMLSGKCLDSRFDKISALISASSERLRIPATATELTKVAKFRP